MNKLEGLINNIVEKIFNSYSEEIKEFENSNSVATKNELYESGKNAIDKIKEKNMSNSNYNIMQDDNLTWFLRQAMVRKLSELGIVKKY